MNLRSKMMVLISVVVTAIFIVLFILSRILILDSFSQMERKNVAENVDRAKNMILDESISLASINRDWAIYDETYRFIDDHNQAYISSNLVGDVYENLNVQMMLFIGPSGRVVEQRVFDASKQARMALPKELEGHLKANSLILKNTARKAETSGVIRLSDGGLIFSACPILKSNGEGPVRGTLVMGRYLNEDLIKSLNQKTKLSFSVTPLNQGQIPDPEIYQQALQTGTVVIPQNRDWVQGYSVLNDLYGQPSMLIKLTLPRSIYRQGEYFSTYFAWMILGLGMLFGLMIFWLMGKIVIQRILYLSEKVGDIAVCGDMSARVLESGQDEISLLSQQINKMLSKIEASNTDIKSSQQKYQQVFDEAPSANYISTPAGELILCNPAFVRLFAFESMEEALSCPVSAYYSDQQKRDAFITQIETFKKADNNEMQLKTRRGKEITILENVVGVFGEDEELLQIQGYMIDISERKRAEDEIRYLSLHDYLTGLYNRAYFEQELIILDCEDHLPLSVIMGDVNGLKMINDALGHVYGDELLVKVAEVITQFCREKDVICRWGGDEFLVLLPDTPASISLEICNQIKDACSTILIKGLQINISLGEMTKDYPWQGMQEILQQAEEKMYRNKLLQLKSNRHALMQSLEKTLQGKSFETEEHAKRLRDLVIRVGVILDLPDSELDELELLAMLHDIGKIAIPDHILSKPDKLSTDEWEIMKKHSEIGYRIAQTSPEMSLIAEAILHHHERWDGKGYPMGLSGKDIPLHSRLIGIVDAFDVMTHERPYKKEMTMEEAIAELQLCAGTQFDPLLVEIFVNTLEA